MIRTITIQDFVNREVEMCVSQMINTLAGSPHVDLLRSFGAGAREPVRTIERARELAAPVPDYAEAAIQAGWKHAGDGWSRPRADDEPESYGDTITVQTADQACWLDDLEPEVREVYEHWCVSEYLAKHLEARGEKVDRDFLGLTVWARTTTGQSITVDAVISDIWEEVSPPIGD